MDNQIKKSLRQEIQKISAVLSEPLNERQEDLLVEYIKLLYKWNQAYNLTAVRKPEEMIKKHIIDSLSVLPILEKDFQKKNILTPRLADVGSGAGLPGIPLAIARPDWHITLIDSNGKKAGFLVTAKRELGLTNILVMNCRAEAAANVVFDAVICRAFASLGDMINLTKNLWGAGGCLWAMKGKYPHEELRQISKSYRVSAAHALASLDATDGERHLLQILQHPIS